MAKNKKSQKEQGFSVPVSPPAPGRPDFPDPPKVKPLSVVPPVKTVAPVLGDGAPSLGGVRPPVAAAYRRTRHVLVVLSFLVMVLVPMIISGIYLWRFAADQYVSKVGFSVSREDTTSALDILGGLTSLGGNSSSDTDILFEFLQSQKLVNDLDQSLGLRKIWSKPENDPVFAVSEDASIEELVNYWNRMVRISYGAGAGLIEVQVRAFTASDATLISEALLNRSSQMINDLNAIAREDSIQYAKEELDAAVERLKSARATVTEFRNTYQLVDPKIDLQSQAGILGTLQSQRVAVQIELDLLSETLRNGDPRMVQARRRLAVIEQRIVEERQKLGLAAGTGDDTAFANIVGEYERLIVDREFAERTYVAALATFDSAQAELRRKSRYLAAYMQPTRAETAIHPKRFTLLALISLFLFLIWSILVLVSYSLKDRR